jgi:hypothetical protein
VNDEVKDAMEIEILNCLVNIKGYVLYAEKEEFAGKNRTGRFS